MRKSKRAGRSENNCSAKAKISAENTSQNILFAAQHVLLPLKGKQDGQVLCGQAGNKRSILGKCTKVRLPPDNGRITRKRHNHKPQKGVQVNENAWYSRQKAQKRRVSFI